MSGATLVTPAWLRDCRVGGQPREPWLDTHEVRGCALHNMTHAGPEQRRLYPEQVFAGTPFYLLGDFSAPNPTRPEMMLLLRAAGATIVPQQPTNARQARSLLVVCESWRANDAELLELRKLQASVVPPAYVMDSISLHQARSPENYRVGAT